MDRVCVVLPVLRGRTTDARAFMEELERHRQVEYAASERRLGISRELWYLAHVAETDLLVGYLEAADFAAAARAFGASSDPFDVWFKRRMIEATGVDLANLPPGFQPAELLSHYEATAAV